ncbi:MAG: phosphonate metabolism protein/1,5-bisphosphokinase (PRPP-forming) PhnN [Fimbriimonadaceae bacterium]|nr:phosphonate metabolism protein/1,5-bisphosphokinase (PRPP-forming) PhnN [Alphaproteobacteria bacterium]
MVVGPSGAGKDSILRYALARFAGDDRFVFPRRCITRFVDVATEDHDSLDEQTFDVLVAQGAFAFKWEAHGLKYGVRREIDEDLAQGRVVSVNVSRTILADIAHRYPMAVVVEISASPEIRAARIAARGRETATDIAQRIGRSVPSTQSKLQLNVIHNDGEISDAGGNFCRLVESFVSNSRSRVFTAFPIEK